MNINGFNEPEAIKQRAQALLGNKEKVELAKEDLTVLWENVKLSDSSISELGISDEAAIAQFDALDNADNTAMTSYKLFFNWLRNAVFSPAAEPETKPDTVIPETPETVTPVTSEVTIPDVEVELVPDTAPDSPLDVLPEVEVVETPNKTQTTNTPKTYIQLFDQESTTVEIDGKKYNITNTSSTVNNFAYYMQNGVLTFEGSDLVIDSLEDNGAVDDNVKLMGNRNELNLGDGNDIAEVEGIMNDVRGGAGDDFVKMRGDYNSTNLGGGNDIAWIAGNTNVAIGAYGDDNFFAIGQGNTLYGREDYDGKYYNESEGIGQSLRIEHTITDGTDFEKWVNGEDPTDGPPYITPPTAPAGHEVRAYDDNTYTDKYEETPNYITEYRDIAYRELQAETTVDRVNVGNATVTKYVDGAASEEIIITKDSVTVKTKDGETVIPADSVVYKDSKGNVVNNTGTIDDLVENLATGKYTVATNEINGENLSPLPLAQEGHEINSFDENTYTDEYKQGYSAVTEYRDIASHQLKAELEVFDKNNIIGVSLDGGYREHARLYNDGELAFELSISYGPFRTTASINMDDTEINLSSADKVVYKDESGNTVTGSDIPGNILQLIAEGKYTIDIAATKENASTVKQISAYNDTTNVAKYTQNSFEVSEYQNKETGDFIASTYVNEMTGEATIYYPDKDIMITNEFVIIKDSVNGDKLIRYPEFDSTQSTEILSFATLADKCEALAMGQCTLSEMLALGDYMSSAEYYANRGQCDDIIDSKVIAAYEPYNQSKLYGVDAETAKQNYDAQMEQLNAKKEVYNELMESGNSIMRQAYDTLYPTIMYGEAHENLSETQLKTLKELTEKMQECMENYLNNDDTQKDAELKAELDALAAKIKTLFSQVN